MTELPQQRLIRVVTVKKKERFQHDLDSLAQQMEGNVLVSASLPKEDRGANETRPLPIHGLCDEYLPMFRERTRTRSHSMSHVLGPSNSCYADPDKDPSRSAQEETAGGEPRTVQLVPHGLRKQFLHARDLLLGALQLELGSSNVFERRLNVGTGKP